MSRNQASLLVAGAGGAVLLLAALLPRTFSAISGQPKAPTAAPAAAAARTVMLLRRVVEPNETAFTILIPDGWSHAGGMFRVNPIAAGGAANAIGAKVDFQVRRDAAGSARMHWLPSMMYKDARRMVGGGMGFPTGSNYMGMTVHPLLDAQTYLLRVVFPAQHRQARNVQVIDRAALPKLVADYQRLAPSMPGLGTFRYDSAALTLTYEESGVLYKEKMMCVIEDMADLGVGAWSNKDTMVARAPAAEFDKLAPLFTLIQGSVALNPVWVEGERRGQAQRAQKALDTQRYVNKVAAGIVENRRRTNAEIAYNMWLNITSQEDYVNPYTGQVEIGSNQWKHRWQRENGDVLYTDDSSYDPNRDPRFTHGDFKRSQARPR